MPVNHFTSAQQQQQQTPSHPHLHSPTLTQVLGVFLIYPTAIFPLRHHHHPYYYKYRVPYGLSWPAIR